MPSAVKFVSYAQNFEDVMLRRALKHVECGFYIDVGAWSPDLDSVTRAFYEMGWCGINIEPNPEFHQQLCAKRPRDLNLQMAVGESVGVLPLTVIGDTGLSTLDEGIACKHEPLGYASKRIEVQVATLAQLWNEHVPAGQEVHFLKVDVEGAERAALAGNNWQTCRPWVIVVEATLPLEEVESYGAWEPILMEADYQFAYADGLNRYYLAAEHADLMSKFRYPPNVFDDFVLRAQSEAETEVKRAHTQLSVQEISAKRMKPDLDALQAELQKAQQANQHYRQLAEASQTRLDSVLNSISWHSTAPLRFFAGLYLDMWANLKGFANRVLHESINVAQRPLSKLMSAVLQRPKLRELLSSFLSRRYPAVFHQLLGIAQRQGMLSSQYPEQSTHFMPQAAVENYSQLSLRGKEIYTDLKVAIQSRHAKN